MEKFGISSSHKRGNKWTEEQLVEMVRSSTNYAQVLRGLGLDARGSNYRTIKRYIRKFGLDVSHFCQDGGVSFGRGRPLSDYLVKGGPRISTSALKRRLLRESLVVEICEVCGLEPEWNGKRLVLRLDHINGDSEDDRIENLRLVCPNCDSQLPTFCGRNKKSPHGEIGIASDLLI